MLTLRKACKTVVNEFLYRIGYYRYLKHVFLAGARKCVILGYHRITDDRGPDRKNPNWYQPAIELGTPLSIFTAQMEFLKEYMTPVRLRDIPDFLEGKQEMPENAVAVTFDDGYRDNFTNAFPVLARYQIPATVFVSTGFIETGRKFWWDEICRILRNAKKQELDVNNIRPLKSALKGNREAKMPLRSGKERETAANQIIAVLKPLPSDEIAMVLEKLRFELEVAAAAHTGDLMLTWQEMKTMSQWVDFESHTVTHPFLSRVHPELAAQEIEESRKALETHLGRPVVGFAYPWGQKETFTEPVKDILRSRDFRYACTSLYGSVSCKSDLFELPRVGLGAMRRSSFMTRQLTYSLKYDRFPLAW
jgi:peptidoglycan/xylan/chitin deacetylase (PgdA/CDA1 family)